MSNTPFQPLARKYLPLRLLGRSLLSAVGVLLLILAGCEFETSAGWDKQSGSNETESVKAEMKMEVP